jgi:branched-chain amino acid transport system substrate-binding protein
MKVRKDVLLVVGLLVSIFLISSSLSHAKEVRGVTDDTILIGNQSSLTGPAADHFTTWTESMKNYYRNQNEQGGIHGRKVKLIVEDTRYAIPVSLATFKKLLYRDKVFALFGPDGTGQAMALKGQIEKLQVPSIGISVAKSLAIPAQRYIFLPGTLYENQVGVIFDYLIDVLKVKNPKIGVVYLDLEFSKVCLRAIQERAVFYGLKLADIEVLSVMNLDSTSQVLNLKKANADYIFLPLSTEFAVNVVKTAKKLGLEATFLGSNYTCEEVVLQNLPFPVKNYMGVTCYNSWYEESAGMKNLRDITVKYDPNAKFRMRMYMQGWISSLIWAEGLKRAGRNLTIEGFVDALESIKNFNTQGISGPLTLGPDDHVVADYCRIYKSIPEKKILAPISDWILPVIKK